MNDPLPSQITERLEAILRRVRRLQFSRGILGLLTMALTSVLIIMGADYLFAPLSASIRWVLFFGLVFVTVVSFWRLFIIPLTQKIELLQIARWLEVKHPDIQERISTSLELAGTSSSGVSENLLKEIIHEAKLDIKDLNPVVEVRSKKVRAWIWPATGLVGIFVVLFAIWPEQIGRLFVRAVVPFSQAGNAGAIAFDLIPGDLEVLADDKIEIKVLYQGSENDILTLETTQEKGDVTQERLHFSAKVDGKHIAVYQLATARESFNYRVRAGRNESDAYQVTVWPRPRLARLDANFDYPGYTGWAPAKRELDAKGIQAIVGTQIQLNGIPNTPVESGTFLIDGKEAGLVKIEGRASGGRISIHFPMDAKPSAQPSVATILLKHRLGRVIEAARFSVKALPDEAPVARILTPTKRELRIKPNDQFTITYQVLEAIGLQAAELLVQINGKQVSSIPQVLPTRVKRSKKPLWNGAIPVYVGALVEQYPKAREIKLRLRIKDNRPDKFGGANIGESETIVLKISRSAESLVRQELRAQESDIRETAEDAAREIRSAKQKIHSNRENIKKEELPKQAQKQLEEAREKLANAEKALEELAVRMENTVHAPKADMAEQAAKKAKEAREKLEIAPLQDTPGEKKKQLENARKAAEEALAEIEKMRQEIKKDRQKVEDVAKLNELAQQERDLARQAEKKAEEQGQQETPENKQEAKQQKKQQQKAEDDWKQKQREVQEKLRREVNERPEAKAEAAKEQAEKARELAEEAHDLSEKQDKLENLTRQAQQQDRDQPDKQADQGEPTKQEKAKEKLEEDIRQQIEKEQEGLLQEAKEQLDQARQDREDRADQLPEAVAEAQKALDKIRKDQPEKAADTAREAAETLEELAKPEAKGSAQEKANEGEKKDQGEQPDQGDKADPELKDLAERQKKVAEALEALGEGDTNKALETLQKLQAEAAEKLADDIEAIPEVNGKSGKRAEAEQAAKQADDHAQEAAKQTEKGNQEAAADRNNKAANALDKAADALEAEAANLDAQADKETAKSAQKQTQGNQAPVDNQQLAEAFQKAAEAAQADSPAEAAEMSKAAADALSQLAEQAMQNMQQGQKLGQQGQSQTQKGQPGQAQQPSPDKGENPDDAPRLTTPDPGVPPELTKLGVSLNDWEKLKEMMRSDVAGSEASSIPEDYRNLVKKYFEEVSREGSAGNKNQ